MRIIAIFGSVAFANKVALINDEDGTCTDDEDFKDLKGRDCSWWDGKGCHDLEKMKGKYVDGFDFPLSGMIQVQTKCQKTCGQCADQVRFDDQSLKDDLLRRALEKLVALEAKDDKADAECKDSCVLHAHSTNNEVKCKLWKDDQDAFNAKRLLKYTDDDCNKLGNSRFPQLVAKTTANLAPTPAPGGTADFCRISMETVPWTAAVGGVKDGSDCEFIQVQVKAGSTGTTIAVRDAIESDKDADRTLALQKECANHLSPLEKERVAKFGHANCELITASDPGKAASKISKCHDLADEPIPFKDAHGKTCDWWSGKSCAATRDNVDKLHLEFPDEYTIADVKAVAENCKKSCKICSP